MKSGEVPPANAALVRAGTGAALVTTPWLSCGVAEWLERLYPVHVELVRAVERGVGEKNGNA